MSVKDNSTPARRDAGLLSNSRDYGYRKLTREEEYQAFKDYRNGDLEARNLLIKSIMPLVTYIASKRYHSKNVDDLEDYIQVGYIGLLKSIEKFDHTRGTRLTTYAWKAINSHITNFKNNTRSLIKVPQIVTDLPIFEDTINDICSLDVELKLPIDLRLDILSERDRWVIEQSYLKERTLQQIGVDLGITRERVNQLRKRAIGKLRNVHCKNKVR